MRQPFSKLTQIKIREIMLCDSHSHVRPKYLVPMKDSEQGPFSYFSSNTTPGVGTG